MSAVIMSIESILIISLSVLLSISCGFSIYAYFFTNTKEVKNGNESTNSLKERGTLLSVLGLASIIHGNINTQNKDYFILALVFFLYGFFYFYRVQNEKNT